MPSFGTYDGASARHLVERERHVLARIARGVPLNEVLEELLLAVEQGSGQHMMTSVLFVSDDGGFLRHGAGPSLPAAYNAAIDGIAVGEGVGSCGTAIARAEPVYANDIATDPLWKDFAGLALGHGLRACWSTPIRTAEGSVLGTFAVYYAEPRAPTEGDLEAIAFVTQTAALAIERHRSDEALRRSQAELTRLAERLERDVATRTQERDRAWRVSQDLLAIATADGILEAVNEAWTRLLGWDNHELVGTPALELAHPDDVAPTQAALGSIMSRPLTVPYEYRLRHKDGGYRWFSWTGTFENGRLYGSGRDVTAHKEREAVLRDTQDFARLALSAVGGVGAWTYEVATDRFHYDANIAELYALDPARGASGVKRTEFLGNVHPEDRASLRDTMARGLTNPGDLELEYRIVHPNGAIRWVHSRGHTYHDADGAPVRRTGIGVDNTSQRQTEEALRQAQKMEAVGQLTGGVAHDFNNLLTVIKSSTDLLKRPNLAEDRRTRYVNAISDTVDRAAKLTGQLLAFARRQALKPEVFAACDSVRTIGEMMATLTGARVEIETDLPAETCFVDADPSQFDTALVNMAVNARDAMDGVGRLKISVRPVEGMLGRARQGAVKGAFVAVSVTDTGCGIPADRIDQIFEPFFTTKGVGQGTGLGLSQVFGFAKQSGGEVTVSSTVGAGTTFTLYLPQVRGDTAAKAKPPEPEPLADGHGTCVLVVEDNIDVGTFATQTLTELGYRTVWAGNAKEALAELDRDPDRFDVVFSDVVMPGMNGIDLAHEIRRRHHDLPVLLASGYSHVLAKNGTYGFELLHKPYSVEDLSRLLRKVATWQRRRRILAG
ncbi:PAS domain S-box-containing protein [Methylobacterium phyllostachyos]|uniref:histidine kinase n=1 Tax=Methylobacterium phyllostachyos TaxID=582672 RepID=A0A1G9WXR7_9HYPH|nr:PAS domain-containing protein [Methylobacterium phyllostachyos]SDM89229.1 PAS domain S-box-containing protein [Methylobacterium phyllostachyos]